VNNQVSRLGYFVTAHTYTTAAAGTVMDQHIATAICRSEQEVAGALENSCSATQMPVHITHGLAPGLTVTTQSDKHSQYKQSLMQDR